MNITCTLLIFFIFDSRILNKLTPEKFDKLSLELLNVGIESHVILKGIILLVSFYIYFGNAEQFCKSGHHFESSLIIEIYSELNVLNC